MGSSCFFACSKCSHLPIFSFGRHFVFHNFILSESSDLTHTIYLGVHNDFPLCRGQEMQLRAVRSLFLNPFGQKRKEWKDCSCSHCQKCPTLWRLRATHYTLWHVVTENSQSVLSKFIISCCAAFIAILGRIWPAGHRLDPTDLTGLLSCANSSFMHWFINWFHTYWLLVVYVLALGIQSWMARSVGIKWLWDPLGPGRIQWR